MKLLRTPASSAVKQGFCTAVLKVHSASEFCSLCDLKPMVVSMFTQAICSRGGWNPQLLLSGSRIAAAITPNRRPDKVPKVELL